MDLVNQTGRPRMPGLLLPDATRSPIHVASSANVATAGSTVLRYWADKSKTVHTWTLPSSLTRRVSTAYLVSGLGGACEVGTA